MICQVLNLICEEKMQTSVKNKDIKLGVSKRTIISYKKGGVIPETKSAILQEMWDEAFETSKKVQEVTPTYGIHFKMVPFLGARAQAGFLSGWGDQDYIEDLPKIPWEVDKEYKATTCALK